MTTIHCIGIMVINVNSIGVHFSLQLFWKNTFVFQDAKSSLYKERWSLITSGIDKRHVNICGTKHCYKPTSQ